MFSGLFRQIDLFGKPVKFNFNGKEKSKSLVGASFSLSFFGFVLWAIYQVGHDIIYRLNPKIITSEDFNENPNPMTLSPETFNFAFGLQHPVTYAHYINDSIYTVEIKHSQLRRIVNENGTVEMKWKTTYLDLETCTTEHFGSLGGSFQNIELNQLYCLKKEQPKLAEIRIQGVFESPLFEDISAVFKQCDPATSKVPCAPQSTLDQLLGSGYFAVYYTNRAINPKNFSNPSIGYRDSYYTTMSNTYLKEITLSLNHVQVKSDIGWLTKEEKLDQFVRFDSLRENINFKSSSKKMITFLLRVGKITTFYERSYTKVQDIVAEANGLATAGLIIAFFFLAPYSNLKFYERLINELFEIKAFQQNDKKKNQNQANLIRKKSSLKGESDNLSKSPLKKHQDSLKDQTTSDNKTQNPILLSRKKTKSLYKYDLTDDENNKDLEPGLGFASSTQTRKVIRAKTFHKSFSNQVDVEIRKDLKSPNHSQDQTSPPLRSPNESIVRLNENKDQNEYLSDSQRKNYKSQPLRQKPKAIQPQIKILENFELMSPGEKQKAFETLIDQQIDNAKKSNPALEDSQTIETNREKATDSAIKQIDKGTHVIKTYNQCPQENEEEKIDRQAGELPVYLNKNSYHLNISFKEYILSYIWRSPSLKEKLGILGEGIKRIEERLDIFNVLKKFREVDKMKLLLLENEQFILFDTLPKPELKGESLNQDNKSFSHSQLKEAKFISEKKKIDLIVSCYKNLKKKKEKTIIDAKLLEIYDDFVL